MWLPFCDINAFAYLFSNQYLINQSISTYWCYNASNDRYGPAAFFPAAFQLMFCSLSGWQAVKSGSEFYVRSKKHNDKNWSSLFAQLDVITTSVSRILDYCLPNYEVYSNISPHSSQVSITIIQSIFYFFSSLQRTNSDNSLSLYLVNPCWSLKCHILFKL